MSEGRVMMRLERVLTMRQLFGALPAQPRGGRGCEREKRRWDRSAERGAEARTKTERGKARKRAREGG
eukprot:830465-Rhodomonas_salina.1